MGTDPEGAAAVSKWKKLIGLNGLVAVAYYIAAQLGLQLELVNEQVTPLWPPTGIALVALLTFGLRAWPGVALGAFLVNLPLGILPATMMITVGNVLAPLAAALVLRHFNFRKELDRLRDVMALVFPAALGCMMISAAVGASTLVASDALGAEDFWSTWAVWWTGDAMGILTVAPVLMMLRRVPAWPVNMRTIFRCTEIWALFVVASAATVLSTWTSMSLTFMVAPCIIWAAFRFGLFGTAPLVLLVSVIAVLGVSYDGGVFGGHDLLSQMVMLQTFIGSAAIVGLLLSAVIEERDSALLQVVRANRDLSSLVGTLTFGRLTEEKIDKLMEIDNEKESNA
jgi:integral membrane sensor domain MASE1